MTRKLVPRRASPDRMLPGEKKKLAGILVGFLEVAGAQQMRAWNSDGDATAYEYCLDTPLGPLAIHFTSDESHLHCRFDDVPRALMAMAASINPYSGKYNVYVFQRCTATSAFQEILLPHLRHIWINAVREIQKQGNPFARYIEACAWMTSFRKWNHAPDSITRFFGPNDAFRVIEQITFIPRLSSGASGNLD